MYFVDENIAPYLQSVLHRGFYDFSFSYRKDKCLFSIRMDREDFRNALKRAACEMEQDHECSRRTILSYDEESGGHYVFTQDIFVTEPEARDDMFLRYLTKGRKYRIVFVYPEFIQTGNAAPIVEHCYAVPHWLSEKVERVLSLSLFRFRREGDRFHVFAPSKVFARVMERAYCEATQEDGPKRFSQSEIDREYHLWGGLECRHHAYFQDDFDCGRAMVIDVDGRDLFSVSFRG